MSKEISKQEKEDYLSLMYEMKRKENQIVKSDLSRELEVPLSRVTRVTDGLLEEGYLLKDEGRRMFLTPMGLSKGQQCLERKRCLTEFLRLVSGVDGSIAKENACAIEHILDERILTGIRMFMESRHTYSYMTRGNDLNLMFPEGKRIMPIAFFEKGTSHPRILSKEYQQFEKRAEVAISKESYLYLKPIDSDLLKKEIRYCYGNQWMYAKKENGKFGILRILQNDRIRSLPLLCIYRINEQQQRQAVTGVFDTADIDTIQKLCQKEKMHLKYESIGKNESKEITKMTYEQLCSSLKKGIYQVTFSIYRQGEDWQSLSMADQGFEKPAYLHLKGDKNYLELAVREMKAMTKGGAMLSGHIQTVKCRSSKDVLTDLPIQDKKIQIPFEDFEFEQLSETEITGQIQLFMTSSVGEKRMPESMATLILKI